MLRHTAHTSKAHRHAIVRRALWSAVGTAAVGLFCSVANAEEGPEQLAVKYADLDLSSPQDAKTLYARLQRASRFVCREFDGREPSKIRLRQKCYDDALSNAVASIDHAILTALHADNNVRLAQRKGITEPRS